MILDGICYGREDLPPESHQMTFELMRTVLGIVQDCHIPQRLF